MSSKTVAVIRVHVCRVLFELEEQIAVAVLYSCVEVVPGVVAAACAIEDQPVVVAVWLR